MKTVKNNTKRFKPGDRVCLMKKRDMFAVPDGTKATIRDVSDRGLIFVIWDKPCIQQDGRYYPRDFEKFSIDTFEVDGEE